MGGASEGAPPPGTGGGAALGPEPGESHFLSEPRVSTCVFMLVCLQVCDDALLHFLWCVCTSKVVCRQLSLTCRRNNRHRSEGEPVAMDTRGSGLNRQQGKQS